MTKELLEMYTDYLLSSFSYTTATGLSILTEGKISHDKVTRFLSKEDFTPSRLWSLIKPTSTGNTERRRGNHYRRHNRRKTQHR